ncbi:MAG: flagellar hook-associated protein FlgK, partial [Rhizobiales bacterium]|nr:flagellar hook-associated protein FlgK [Hyphomicrobiales bacterium]
VTVTRASDARLLGTALSAKAASAGDEALLAALDRLHDTIGDAADASSPAALVGTLADALTQYANAPDDRQRGQGVVAAAQDLAGALNRGAAAVSTLRGEADRAIGVAVEQVNDLLARLADLNATITSGSAAGIDVTASIDQRDGLVSELAGEMGVTVVQRPRGEIAIYTDSGVPLLDRTARTVSFRPTTAFDASTTGAAVYVDGVPVAGPSATMPLRAGRIVGLASARDEIAMRYQVQLDETARGLVSAFAEADQGGAGAPLAGLFTWSGGPAIPAEGTHVPGLAAGIAVNAAVDPSRGGKVERLRDGGINGAAYAANAAGTASFAGRIEAMAAGLAADRSFDARGGIGTDVALGSFATDSAGWLEAARKTASASRGYNETLFSRARDALSNAIGVN